MGRRTKGKNSCVKPVAFWLKKKYSSIYNLSCSTKDLRRCRLVGNPLMPILGIRDCGLSGPQQGAKFCSHSLCGRYNGYSRQSVPEQPSLPAHSFLLPAPNRENVVTTIQFLFVVKLCNLFPGFTFSHSEQMNKIREEKLQKPRWGSGYQRSFHKGNSSTSLSNLFLLGTYQLIH